jgi:hypothetical protein
MKIPNISLFVGKFYNNIKNLKIPKKFLILAAIIVVIFLYLIFFSGLFDDNSAPEIKDVTGNITASAGETVRISVNFTDNIEVTNATIYFRNANEVNWSFMSILNGSVDIFISLDPVLDLHYYITVDDEKNNGPVGDPSVDGSSYYTITVIENINDENDNNNSIHYVFVEEGTSTDCKNCPIVANILDELYLSGKYDFYYVSLVNDRSSDAQNRLNIDYDVYGFPTVFIDGGYRVIVGGNNAKSVYEKAILDAKSRDIPDVNVVVNADYNGVNDELTTNIIVSNNENEKYEGRLRVYLTEIVSKWNGYDGKPYHYSLVNYVINEVITIDSNGEKNFSETISISDFDNENLMIMAVVFNGKSNNTYVYPNEQDHSFDTYYVDAVDATMVAEGGNLPPEVGITSPIEGKIYLSNSPIFEFVGSLENTFLFGKNTIKVYASDDSGIEKVEFYLDGNLMKTDSSYPYEWELSKDNIFKELFLRKHNVMVIAYDMTGKSSPEKSIEVWVRL